MKKFLFVFGAVSVASVAAFAKTIDFDTIIKWNSDVIDQALNKAGLLGSQNAAWDVRVTHDRILAELLKKESFSIRTATAVCLDKCNMSDFLKNGRGQSGKKCPDLCSDFANALIDVNNEYQKTGIVPQSMKRVYSEDKLFYVEEVEPTNNSRFQPASKYRNVCERKKPIMIECEGVDYGPAEISAVVYESDTKTPVALLYDYGCPMYGTHMTYCVSAKYAWFFPGGEPAGYCSGDDDCGFYYSNDYGKTANFWVSDSIVKYKQDALKNKEQEYAKLVEQNGDCPSGQFIGYTIGNVDCESEARKYSLSHACKLHSYQKSFCDYTGSVDTFVTTECFMNQTKDMKPLGDMCHIINTKHDYSPSWDDCVATFDEQKCDGIANGNYID